MNTLNEVQLTYKPRKINNIDTQIVRSDISNQVLASLYDTDTIGVRECFKVLLLNNNNYVIGVYNLSEGGLTNVFIDIRLLFAAALKSLATSIIIGHNHPSGNLNPSKNDIELTEKIKKASELLDIRLLDHIILSPAGTYYSFADEGKL